MKLFFFISFTLSVSLFIYPQSIIRITNGEWEPYLSEYSYEYGLGSHIVTEAFSRSNIEVEWSFFPWNKSYELAKFGVRDGSALWFDTSQTREDFLVSEPVLESSMVFFHLKSLNLKWNSFADLEGLVVGITNGYQYGEEFTEFLRSGKVRFYIGSSDEQLYKLLLKGRIDIFPNDPVVGSAQIKNSLSHEQGCCLTYNPKSFFNPTLNLVISRNITNGEILLDKFNSGLKEIKDSGRIDRMKEDAKNGVYDKKPVKFSR